MDPITKKWNKIYKDLEIFSINHGDNASDDLLDSLALARSLILYIKSSEFERKSIFSESELTLMRGLCKCSDKTYNRDKIAFFLFLLILALMLSMSGVIGYLLGLI